MDKKNITSIADAFLALSLTEDEDIEFVSDKNLTEAKEFNIADESAVEAAKNFREDAKKASDEITLEVIDADADTVEHMKDKKSYIGQMILQCNSCKATKFIDANKLEANAVNTELYNEEDECPHCHNLGTGYSLIGQVGKEAEAENNETITDADATFDNDIEDNKEEDDRPDTEETPEDVDSEDELAYDETEEEDDEIELPKLGEEYDPDDVDIDDTEVLNEDLEIISDVMTEPEEMDAQILTAEADEIAYNTIESGELSAEQLGEELDLTSWDGSIADFLDAFSLEDSELTVKVFNKNGTEVGTFNKEEIPFDVASLTVDTFNTEDNVLDLEVITLESDSQVSISDLFSLYRADEHADITFLVTDVETEDTEEFDNVADLIDKFGDYALSNNIEVKTLNIYTNDTDVETEVDELSDDEIEALPDNTSEGLLESILVANNLKSNRISNPNSNEYFIAESIKFNEDLDKVYSIFIQPTENEELIEKFKDVTGYRDEVDLFLESQGIARELYKKVLKESNKEKETLLTAKTEATLYKSVKDRSELKDLVEVLQDENKSYKITKSLDENYRYDVYLTEAPLRFEPAVIEPDVEQVTGEIVDRIPSDDVEETGIVPEGMDPRDVETVTKINRIARDIHDAILDNYGVDAPANLIVADIIQDLQLVGGARLVDDLENTPVNQVTAELYRQFNGAWDAIDDLMSFVTGQRISTSQASRLAHSLESLDGRQFETEYIRQGIASDQFLGMAAQGMVPYVDARQIVMNNPDRVRALPAAHRRGRIAAYDPSNDARAQARLGNVRPNTLPHRNEALDGSEISDFSDFDECINEYFAKNYNQTLSYISNKASVIDNKLVVEGIINSEESSKNIKFTFNENLNESIEDKLVFDVTNNISEEVIKYSINK